MSQILILIDSPMMHYGEPNRIQRSSLHDTQTEPTKSAIIGMIGAALGVQRDDKTSIQKLAKMPMDTYGYIKGNDFLIKIKDFCTIGANYSNEMKKYYAMQSFEKNKNSKNLIKNRLYLCDVCYFIALESTEEELLKIKEGLKNPKYFLYAGKKSCPLSSKPYIGIFENEKELKEEMEKIASKKGWNKFLETLETRNKNQVPFDTNSIMVNDVPVSYEDEERKFGFRFVEKNILYMNNENEEIGDFNTTIKTEEPDMFSFVNKLNM